MPKWIALSKSEHASSYYLPRQGYTFAINQPVANVLLAELPKLLPHYALGFIQQGDRYQPVVLLSLDGQNNLYLHSDGRWLGSYVPASLRGYPFTLADTEDGQKALCLDQAHLTHDQGNPLFDEKGNLTQEVAKTLDFLQQCEQNRQTTEACAQKLHEAGVIEAWPLTLDRSEGQEPLKVNGLYRVSEQALNALDAEIYATLRGGPMALAHAQLFSMSQLNQLVERAKFHTNQGSVAAPENLDTLFDGDDEFEFDFN